MSTATRILVLGDFSGQASAPGNPTRLDRDNFDQVLKALAPHVEVANSMLRFTSLADFDPETIQERSELFAHLREKRELYVEQEEGETDLRSLLPTVEQIERLISPGSLLDAMVEQTAAKKKLAESIAAPYSAPVKTPERVQQAGSLIRQILHNEQFQALEAAWRGLDLLVRRLDTDTEVELFISDAAKVQLTVEGAWHLVVVNYAFDRSDVHDVQILERLTRLGVPVIAECQPSQNANLKAWGELRKSAGAVNVALALPRFLLRSPHEEERAGKLGHTDYLWGNPAFLCALGERRVEDLPIAGESCGEILLSDRDYQALLDEGLTPILSEKNADVVAIPRVASIAEPAAPLARFGW